MSNKGKINEFNVVSSNNGTVHRVTGGKYLYMQNHV